METQGYLTAIVSLIFVLGLIGVIAILARRLGVGIPLKIKNGSKGRRIKIVEVSPLDAKRQLILIQRDNIEHLILISPTSELVVESGINVNQNNRYSANNSTNDSSYDEDNNDTCVP